MDRGGWRATVHGIAKSQTQLNRVSTHEANSVPGSPQSPSSVSSFHNKGILGWDARDPTTLKNAGMGLENLSSGTPVSVKSSGLKVEASGEEFRWG